MKHFLILSFVIISFGANAQKFRQEIQDYNSVVNLRNETLAPKKNDKAFIQTTKHLYSYDLGNTTSPDDGLKYIVQTLGSYRWVCLNCHLRVELSQDSILLQYDANDILVQRDTIRLLKGADKFHTNILGTAPYDPLLPLTGWVAPTAPIAGNTVEVKFTDGTVGNYTYDGTVWGLNFIDKTLAQHDLRLLTNGTVERGSDSAIDPKGAQFLHDSYSHLNGFSDNWVGLNGFRFNINNESLFSHYTPDLTGFTDNRYLWKIQALSDKNVNFNFSTSTTHIPTTNTNNDVFMLGWNLSPGGGAEVIGKTGIGLSFENHYEPTVGDDAAEHHTFFIDKSGSQRRLSSFTINKDVPLDWNYYKTVALDYLKNPINDVTYSRTQVAPSGDVYFLLTDGLVDNLKGLETYVSPSQNLVYFRPKNMQSAANSIWQNGLDFGDFGNINTSAFNVIKYQNLVTFMFKSPLPVHADNASALTAGRQVGELYRTSDGTVKIVY